MKSKMPNLLSLFQSPAMIGSAAVLVAVFAALTVASAWAVTSARALPSKADSVVEESAGQAILDCSYCGVVESVRRLAPVGKAAANYEFTIRIGGERHLIQDASPTSWRMGERMILIAGRAS